MPALRRRADLAANWRGTAAGWATTAFMAVRRVVTRCECAVRWNAWVRALYVSGVAWVACVGTTDGVCPRYRGNRRFCCLHTEPGQENEASCRRVTTSVPEPSSRFFFVTVAQVGSFRRGYGPVFSSWLWARIFVGFSRFARLGFSTQLFQPNGGRLGGRTPVLTPVRSPAERSNQKRGATADGAHRSCVDARGGRGATSVR